jgi:branched-subunit amino acid transport protein
MILAAIILTGIGSYFMRVFFIFALARYQFPPIMLQALEYVAPTVMAALVVSLLTTPNGELIAGVPEIVGLVGTAVAAKVSGNHILALLTGMMTYWLIGWIM